VRNSQRAEGSSRGGLAQVGEWLRDRRHSISNLLRKGKKRVGVRGNQVAGEQERTKAEKRSSAAVLVSLGG